MRSTSGLAITLLTLAAAMPAFAQDPDRPRRESDRAERWERRLRDREDQFRWRDRRRFDFDGSIEAPRIRMRTMDRPRFRIRSMGPSRMHLRQMEDRWSDDWSPRIRVRSMHAPRIRFRDWNDHGAYRMESRFRGDFGREWRQEIRRHRIRRDYYRDRYRGL